MNPSLPARILVAADCSQASGAALQYALRLAAAFGAEVHATYVTPVALSPEPPPAAASGTAVEAARAGQPAHNVLTLVREAAEAEFRQFVSQYNPEARAIRCHVRSGDPRHQLLECAAELGADWLIVGSHNRTAVEHWLLGSVAEHVLRHARIPVLLVPPNPSLLGAQT